MFNVVSFNYLDFFGFEKMIERKILNDFTFTQLQKKYK